MAATNQPTASSGRPGKRQEVAILLALLLNCFSWAYTWKFDRWKFLAGLSLLIASQVIFGPDDTGIVSPAAIAWAGVTGWALIDQIVKPRDWWDSYHRRPWRPEPPADYL